MEQLLLGIKEIWFEIGRKFTAAFLEGDRWKLYFKGLGITMEVALMAVIE